MPIATAAAAAIPPTLHHFALYYFVGYYSITNHQNGLFSYRAMCNFCLVFFLFVLFVSFSVRLFLFHSFSSFFFGFQTDVTSSLKYNKYVLHSSSLIARDFVMKIDKLILILYKKICLLHSFLFCFVGWCMEVACPFGIIEMKQGHVIIIISSLLMNFMSFILLLSRCWCRTVLA